MLPLDPLVRSLLDRPGDEAHAEALAILAEHASQAARAGIRPTLEEWRLAHPAERVALANACDVVAVARARAAAGPLEAAAALAEADGGAAARSLTLDAVHAATLAAARSPRGVTR